LRAQLSSTRHVEDRVCLLGALLQRFNGLGRRESEQFDFAALSFAFDFLHHRQPSIRLRCKRVLGMMGPLARDSSREATWTFNITCRWSENLA
jgi:hypothetical protein